MTHVHVNRFANARSFGELEEMYEDAISVENFGAGERTPAETDALHQQILDDYNARDEELELEYNNPANQSPTLYELIQEIINK
jgi:hypothetical protein